MFIQIEETPNPNTLKFVPRFQVLSQGTLTVDRDTKQVVPLATELLSIEQVERIFLTSTFISVTKSEDSDWELIKPLLLSAMISYFMSGQGVIKVNENQSNHSDSMKDPIADEIREIIETKVRPAVAEDGGDIVFKNFVDGIVFLELHGACAGCPSSVVTLKNGIETMLKHYVPAVQEVRAV